MKRLHNAGKRPRPLIDTPQTAARRLLKTGGVSLFLHLVAIIVMICYLMAGSPNGGEGGNGGGSSVYRVSIRPLSSRNKSNSPLLRGLSPAQVVLTGAHIKKDEDRSGEKQKQTTPTQMASTVELSAGDESVAGVGDSAIQEGSGAGGQGDGTGTGDDTGAGWNIFGLKGFGRSNASAPRYLDNPKPVYPLEARQKGYHGKVLLKVEVLSNGRVGEVKVERSSGYEILDQSALATVKKWRFLPAKRGKIAILSWVNILITFQLRDSGF